MTWARAVLLPRGTSTVGAVGGQDDRLVVGAAEHRSPADVVDDEQVAALAGELGAGEVEHVAGVVAGLGGEARRPPRPAAAGRGEISARMSGFCTSSIAGAEPSSAFLILASLTAVGPEVGGRRGHHHRVGGRGGQHDLVAQLRGRLDPHDVDAGRVGQRDVGADQGDLGAARGGRPGEGVALQARGAVAEEADRVEVLAGAAGGDHDLAAGEVGRRAAPRASTSTASSKISAGSGSRPLPVSAPVRRPSAGSTTTTPRLRSVATLAGGGRVLPHLGVHRRARARPGSGR